MGGLNIKYDVNIRLVSSEKNRNNAKEEIWAEINNRETGERLNKCIWWRDIKGCFHDESPSLPLKFRDIVDDAWIRSVKKF